MTLMRFHTIIFWTWQINTLFFIIFFYVSIICFSCANYMVISDKFVEK